MVEPSCAKISDLVINYIQLGSVTPEQVAEFRQMLEPSVVALAAERRNEADLEAIRTCIDVFRESLAGGKVDPARGVEFHRLIADACHNPLISAVTAAVVDVFEDIIATVPMSLDDARIDLEFCMRFYDCLVERDQEGAARLMKAHFDVLSDIIKRPHRNSG